ncbi:MAG: monovalent cation/H+ antiporter subunit D [Acidobacteria bacterium]|nr:monovalent cation/H+ antiporter subunit D [Acidobacteriota bacterium]
MNHLIALPIILPAFAGVAILLGARANLRLARTLSLGASVGLVLVAVRLLMHVTDGTVEAYALGNWVAPYGIVIVLDGLSGFMVLMTAIVGLGSQLYAVAGCDARGANYHAMFQFQMMGLCGAFLTGDVFNLFVFFEVLLIASYGLLLHGGGRNRVRAGVHYVVFNLVGSALFLIGVGTIYGVAGTLNMADLAVKVAQVAPADATLLQSGALILLVVFAIKAAALPLGFWLPRTYGSATAPVAALFAIMTKVGVYAIIRVYTLIFGQGGGPVADLAQPWLLPVGLATLVVATVGAVAGRRLRGLAAYLVIASVGTMLTAVGLGTAESLGAALYYMAHSTFVLAALFLVIDLITRQRGQTGDRLKRAAPVSQSALLGTLFLVAGVAVTGLPPLSGFIGKVLVLSSTLEAPEATLVFALVLAGGLFSLIAMSRAGSMIFWNVTDEKPVAVQHSAARLAGVGFLLGVAVAMAVFAGPIVEFTQRVGASLVHPDVYIDAVLSDPPPAVVAEPHGAGQP